MSAIEIGCCGAYCRTCLTSITGSTCRGCKLGYEGGGRDINKSKCRIKLCCFRDKGLETCADCDDFSSCVTIQGLYARSGYKYHKYRQSLIFIRENGYQAFLNIADSWKGPYGKTC